MKNRNLPNQDYKLITLPNKMIKVLVDGKFAQLNTVGMEQVFHALMFLLAYPQSEKQEVFALKKLNTVAAIIKNKAAAFKNKLINSGLPFTNMSVQFTHDFLQWLLQQKELKVKFRQFVNSETDLNELLKLTLNPAEKSETTAGLSNEDLLHSLGIEQHEVLNFLLDEFSKIYQPEVKDYLFDSVGLQCDLIPQNKFFSLPYNRFTRNKTFYHEEILKKFDYKNVLDSEINPAVSLSENEHVELIKTIKYAMVLTNRETDTVTYMDENTLQYFELERGISVAIYGMTPDRQLPFESYIGYTLFKNGFPCAYGGSWVFGKRALFGINIFEWFRGGESGYVLCQLLRVFHKVFDVDYFEVEPYQYGLDNPDGISSGAFWFYYKFGFRPVDKELKKIAEREFHKIKSKQNYRTQEKTLLRFTESNISLTLEKINQAKIVEVTSVISGMIKKQFKGNRMQAEQECVSLFLQKAQRAVNHSEYSEALLEMALLCEAYKIKDDETISLLYAMAHIKPVNPYDYQGILLKFLEKIAK
ncbi:MAG TPA: hypothetical protein PLU85_08990 [Bacteroidia bacterium]|nr:hypothetical protein [Bacteroidia bacterium]QQR94113.1 MAG: hypothetical protein IPJ93_09350 [Bacteroidota bacterium]MBP7713174.1 hypothetical protein [Bacteroidia bacterium]MBP8667277.1 hypothetical protein [Bacteroidia bacterium]HOZ90970.1 hypothetical protein [Bacteroidia bacterium]